MITLCTITLCTITLVLLCSRTHTLESVLLRILARNHPFPVCLRPGVARSGRQIAGDADLGKDTLRRMWHTVISSITYDCALKRTRVLRTSEM